MRRTRTVLTSAFSMLVLLGGLSACLAQSAEDECLPKPSGAAPQGQHWYYRIDHANNGRQCWYLRAESPRSQKKVRQAEGDSSDVPDESAPAPVQRVTRTARAAAAPAQRATPTARETEVPAQRSAAPALAPIPWLNVQKLPEPMPLVQPAAEPRLDTATEAVAAALPAPAAEQTIQESGETRRETVGTAASDNPTPPVRAKEQQRPQRIQSASAAPATTEIDHTFALLVIVLAAITIAGPALYCLERLRRRREALNVRPPRWARVVALNAPKPRVRVSTNAAASLATRPAPLPLAPPDQTERLAHALQQLVDRLQTMEKTEPEAAGMQPRRASM